jgi:hypothetical protein
MNTTDKKQSIKNRVEELLKDSYIDAQKKIDKAINSGAIDIENWDPNYNSWILPKIIVTAILENASQDYQGKGTEFEKQIKKEVNNLKLFL